MLAATELSQSARSRSPINAIDRLGAFVLLCDAGSLLLASITPLPPPPPAPPWFTPFFLSLKGQQFKILTRSTKGGTARDVFFEKKKFSVEQAYFKLSKWGWIDVYSVWRLLLTFVSIKTLGAREKSTRYLRERRKENFGEAVVISIIIYRVPDESFKPQTNRSAGFKFA